MAKMDWSKRPPEYRSWSAMLTRCRNKKDSSYPRYGGRGITVCDRWLIFENFFEDMGVRPSARHSLERIKNNEGYRPDNCRWATVTEQARNRRSNTITIEKVNFIRENAGKITQVRLAEIVGTSQPHVSRIILRQSWPIDV